MVDSVLLIQSRFILSAIIGTISIRITNVGDIWNDFSLQYLVCDELTMFDRQLASTRDDR
jgi:hypothetical protein